MYIGSQAPLEPFRGRIERKANALAVRRADPTGALVKSLVTMSRPKVSKFMQAKAHEWKPKLHPGFVRIQPQPVSTFDSAATRKYFSASPNIKDHFWASHESMRTEEADFAVSMSTYAEGRQFLASQKALVEVGGAVDFGGGDPNVAAAVAQQIDLVDHIADTIRVEWLPIAHYYDSIVAELPNKEERDHDEKTLRPIFEAFGKIVAMKFSSDSPSATIKFESPEICKVAFNGTAYSYANKQRHKLMMEIVEPRVAELDEHTKAIMSIYSPNELEMRRIDADDHLEAGLETLRNSPDMDSVKIEGKYLTDDHVDELCTYLERKRNKVTSLYLGNNMVTERGVDRLIQLLKRRTDIMVCELDWAFDIQLGYYCEVNLGKRPHQPDWRPAKVVKVVGFGRGEQSYELKTSDGDQISAGRDTIRRVVRATPFVPLSTGMIADARYQDGYEWYAGKIVQCRSSGTYDILYADGDEGFDMPRASFRNGKYVSEEKLMELDDAVCVNNDAVSGAQADLLAAEQARLEDIRKHPWRERWRKSKRVMGPKIASAKKKAKRSIKTAKRVSAEAAVAVAKAAFVAQRAAQREYTRNKYGEDRVKELLLQWEDVDSHAGKHEAVMFTKVGGLGFGFKKQEKTGLFMVAKVLKRSHAYKLGVRTGDTIVQVGKQPVSVNMEELDVQDLVRACVPPFAVQFVKVAKTRERKMEQFRNSVYAQLKRSFEDADRHGSGCISRQLARKIFQKIDVFVEGELVAKYLDADPLEDDGCLWNPEGVDLHEFFMAAGLLEMLQTEMQTRVDQYTALSKVYHKSVKRYDEGLDRAAFDEHGFGTHREVFLDLIEKHEKKIGTVTRVALEVVLADDSQAISLDNLSSIAGFVDLFERDMDRQQAYSKRMTARDREVMDAMTAINDAQKTEGWAHMLDDIEGFGDPPPKFTTTIFSFADLSKFEDEDEFDVEDDTESKLAAQLASSLEADGTAAFAETRQRLDVLLGDRIELRDKGLKNASHWKKFSAKILTNTRQINKLCHTAGNSLDPHMESIAQEAVTEHSTIDIMFKAVVALNMGAKFARVIEHLSSMAEKSALTSSIAAAEVSHTTEGLLEDIAMEDIEDL
jgi:hypothetical protein